MRNHFTAMSTNDSRRLSRFPLLVVILCCLNATLLPPSAATTKDRKGLPKVSVVQMATQQVTSADSCTPPALTVITDPAGDHRHAPWRTAMNLLSLSVAELYAPDENGNPVGEITFTIKVADLSSISTDARWQVE